MLAIQETKSEGSWLEASPGKSFERPYLENTHYKKSAGRVAQGVGQIQTPVPPKKKEKVSGFIFFSLE
jgi:hypothetical protein